MSSSCEYTLLKKKVNTILKNKDFSVENIYNCENVLDHVFRILTHFSDKTKTEIINECNNAFVYYIEFVKQLRDNDNIEIQFTEVDINTFIFNKIFKDIKVKV
jgi:hypothetical protein